MIGTKLPQLRDISPEGQITKKLDTIERRKEFDTSFSGAEEDKSLFVQVLDRVDNLSSLSTFEHIKGMKTQNTDSGGRLIVLLRLVLWMHLPFSPSSKISRQKGGPLFRWLIENIRGGGELFGRENKNSHIIPREGNHMGNDGLQGWGSRPFLFYRGNPGIGGSSGGCNSSDGNSGITVAYILASST